MKYILLIIFLICVYLFSRRAAAFVARYLGLKIFRQSIQYEVRPSVAV